jgi:hypothetical protein
MQFLYGKFFMRLCKQSSRWKDMLDTGPACKTYHTKPECTNGLPDDEQMMFETCRRHQELIQNINLKECAFVG